MATCNLFFVFLFLLNVSMKIARRKLSHYPQHLGTRVSFCKAGMFLLLYFQVFCEHGSALVSTNVSKGEVVQPGLFR